MSFSSTPVTEPRLCTSLNHHFHGCISHLKLFVRSRLLPRLPVSVSVPDCWKLLGFFRLVRNRSTSSSDLLPLLKSLLARNIVYCVPHHLGDHDEWGSEGVAGFLRYCSFFILLLMVNDSLPRARASLACTTRPCSLLATGAWTAARAMHNAKFEKCLSAGLTHLRRGERIRVES